MSLNNSKQNSDQKFFFDDILKIIIYKCRENNSPVAESLIAYLLRISVKPSLEFYFEKRDFLLEKDKDELVSSILSLLKSKKDGILEMLMLQVKYEISNIEEENKLKNLNIFFDNEQREILEEIKKFIPITKKDYDNLKVYKKIFTFLLIKTKQNTQESNEIDDNDQINQQKNNLIEKEIYSAFDNVLPKSGLPPFIALNANDKESQLNELSNIVFGIRLLNKELGKGGVGLMSLDDIKRKKDNKFIEEINERQNKILEILKKYIDIYEAIDFSLIIEDHEVKVLEKLRKFIIFFNQLNIFFTLLKSEVSSSINTIDNLCLNYSKELQYLLGLVEKKSALSKEQVYPRFESLTHIYSKFQEQFFIMTIKKNIYNEINQFLETCPIPNKEFDIKEIEPFGRYILNIVNKKQKISNIDLEQGTYQSGVTILFPNSIADYMDLKLEYQGFCIVTLTKKNGLLVLGTPNIVAKYENKFYVFYNEPALQDFLYEPDKFVRDLNIYLKKNPYLINLLNANEDFPNTSLLSLFKSNNLNKYKSSSLTVDSVVQTVDHPLLETIPKELQGKIKFDRDYIWNEWELKMKALQLADITNKETKSCQTDLSHFRKEKETQIYQKTETGVNTMISKGTSLSITRDYVVGLREYDNSHLK